MIELRSFRLTDVEAAYTFLENMARITPGLCSRPKEALIKAAAKSEGGIIAFQDKKIVGFTALYDTAQPAFVETGSTCVASSQRKSGLGSLLLAMAISRFYENQTNTHKTIIGDVFEINPAALHMVLGLGFKEIEPPIWFDEGRKLKGEPQEIALPYHCITIDRLAVPNLQRTLRAA